MRPPDRRRGAVRRPGHRQDRTASPPRPRSSTSTSTPPPSGRTSRWRSRSWATASSPWASINTPAGRGRPGQPGGKAERLAGADRRMEEHKTPWPTNRGPTSSSPSIVIEKLYELTEGEAIITTEVGQNQMWAAQYYHFDRPRPFHHLRRAGRHGVRPARGHRRPGGLSGQARGGHRRRRQHPDEHPGDGHGRAVSTCRSRSSS